MYITQNFVYNLYMIMHIIQFLALLFIYIVTSLSIESVFTIILLISQLYIGSKGKHHLGKVC